MLLLLSVFEEERKRNNGHVVTIRQNSEECFKLKERLVNAKGRFSNSEVHGPSLGSEPPPSYSPLLAAGIRQTPHCLAPSLDRASQAWWLLSLLNTKYVDLLMGKDVLSTQNTKHA